MDVEQVTVVTTKKIPKILVAQQVATVGVVVDKSYIAKSRASVEALKSANLLKSLNLNALIHGERGVGKYKLANYVMDAPTIDGSKLQELLSAIEIHDKLIVKNFDKISNYTKVKNSLNKHKNRMIATSTSSLNNKIEDEFFSLKIYIPPLSQRPEDVEGLCELFYDEASEIFGKQANRIDCKNTAVDISENCYSLRRSIYSAYLKNSFDETDIMNIMENFLLDKLEEESDYRNLLYLFDVPLIKSGFAKFGSQLSMSKAFGLNRNTLRKKINEYRLDEEKK
ncbi:Fis family transcriptional regulator [Sulfurospirillum sp. 1612]|uniref:Fis family transcriptional regulator n=1 Tax=Sulfurospirillum sp. 1612 TaxID=3094835 RepID=UPI002F94F55B